MIADARRFGASEEKIAELRAARKPEFIVWGVNAEAVAAFRIAESQWRTASVGARIVFIGLDHTAAIAGVEKAGMNWTPELWSDFRVMEDEAISVLNDR